MSQPISPQVSPARAEVLGRIRRALADRPAPTPVARDYHGAGQLAARDLPALFAERVGEYRATVYRCATDQVARRVAEILAGRDARRVAVPDGFPATWLAAGAFEVVSDEPPLPAQRLDDLDGALTGCACAIALTGTIVLDAGPGQGRRALTLVPDYHLVVVREDQIVPGVPDALAVLDPIRPQTWISGPSATSDIELSRVEGVHGPRTLDVLIVA